MQTKLLQNNSDELIIFFSGWGCDDNSFDGLSSKKDILLCWDYSDLTLNFNFSKYERFYLLAYSAGAFAASLLQDILPEKFIRSVLINGNPLLFDDYFGIEKVVLKKMENINIDNAMEFLNNYIVYSENDFAKYKFSKRTFESSTLELSQLKKYYQNDFKPFDFDIALVSDNDKIFIPQRQMEYFKNKYIIMKNASHSLFENVNSFDEFFTIALPQRYEK